MKNLKLLIILFVFVAFGSSPSVLSQNKVEDTKVESNAIELDKKIKALEVEMENASPEEKARMQKKINIYMQESNRKGDVQDIEIAKQQLIEEDQKLKQAFAKNVSAEKTLNLSAERISAARKMLNEAKEDGSLSAQEINEREAKIVVAEKELKEASYALEKNKSLIMKKHNENSEAPRE